MARMGNKTIQDAQKAVNKTDDELNVIEARTLGVYAVADLPSAGTEGRTAFASDGRKNGETAGNGTGVLVFDDGSDWIAVDTGATVAA